MAHSTSRLLIAFCISFLAVLVVAMCLGERLHTPAHEMKTLLKYVHAVEAAERAFHQDHEAFGLIAELTRPRADGRRYLQATVPRGYSVQLRVHPNGYDLTVGPFAEAGPTNPRRLSLYLDGTGVIRYEYGRRKADADSKRIPGDN